MEKQEQVGLVHKEEIELDKALGVAREKSKDFLKLMSYYKCAMMEIETKLNVLKEEFSLSYDRSPINSISSRLKAPQAIFEKLKRYGQPQNLVAAEEYVNDIAGVRVTCLADIIAKAKAANMPNDNIQRSIKKASGEMSGTDYKELTYEGYGVAGSAVIVTTLTDNVNRTAGDVRAILSKHGGSLGTTGSVSYNFDNKGYIVIERTVELDEDTMTEYALEAGADDVEVSDDVYEIYTAPEAFSDVRKYLEEKNAELMAAAPKGKRNDEEEPKIRFIEAEVAMIPQNRVTLPEDKVATFLKMLDALEEHDDVQNVYHNVDLPDEE